MALSAMTVPTQTTPPGSPLTKPGGIFYGWKLVGVTLFALAMIGAATFQGMGTFFVALERHFGWSRTMLSGAFSLSRAEGALLGPVEGVLTDRLGSRRMVLLGFAILGAGFVGLSFVRGPVAFYIAFVVIYTGAGLGGLIPLMTAINHWFTRRRTVAMAVGMSGFNLGGLLVPALAWVVFTFGWQRASLGLGLGAWAFAVPLSLLVHNRPEDYGLRPDGVLAPSPETSDPSTPEAGERDDESFTLREAVRTRAFWLITLCHGFSVTAFVTVSVHIFPALTDLGMSPEMAGVVVATYTFTGAGFQLVAGLIGDRFPKPPLIFVFVCIQAISMVVIAFTRSVPVAFLFAVLYGIGFGGRTPLLTAIRGDYFGRSHFATIMGASQLPMNLFMMGGPVIAGYLYDRLESYLVPFLGLAALSLAGAFLILPARKPLRPTPR